VVVVVVVADVHEFCACGGRCDSDLADVPEPPLGGGGGLSASVNADTAAPRVSTSLR